MRDKKYNKRMRNIHLKLIKGEIGLFF